MIINQCPCKEFLDECLEYNGLTGQFTWKERPVSHFKNNRGHAIWTAQNSGKKAGSTITTNRGKKYSKISISKAHYYSHRIAIIMSGFDLSTDQEVDHINGDGSDNRIVNLRVVTRSENNINKRMMSTNKSGVTGVSFLNREKKWRARISKGGKELTLGVFNNFDDAVKARRVAEVKLGFHENHGKRKVDEQL